VTGVVMRSGESIRARKGVILATGTYSANPQMSWEFEQLPGVAKEASSLAPASLTGDGHIPARNAIALPSPVQVWAAVQEKYTRP